MWVLVIATVALLVLVVGIKLQNRYAMEGILRSVGPEISEKSLAPEIRIAALNQDGCQREVGR